MLQFLLQAVPDLTAGHELAFAAGQRAGVHAEVHGQGRLVDLEHGQRRRLVLVGHGDADADVGNAVDQHDFAGAGFSRLHAVQALEGQHLVDAALDGLAVRTFHDQHVGHGLERALADAANADAAHEGREVEGGNLQLQRRVRITLLRRHVLQDGVEQGRHVGAPLLARRAFFERRPAVDARGVHHGEVELFVGRAELVEQVEGGIDHLVGVRAGLVDLVHDQDGLQAQGQRLLGHETRLRHRAFLRVDQQHHAVDHRQCAFHFTAEVRVTRGVDDVDVRAFPGHGAVLGQDRDATFLFDRVVVHHRVDDLLVLGEGARLAQQLVDHGGLAMVHVGNDGDIADLLGTHGVASVCGAFKRIC
ncbi:hypothetical protein D9M69_464550 [compost metagenome]